MLALVFGYIAKKQIDESNGTQSGRGLAIAGIVIGWVEVGLMVVGTAVIIIVLAVAGTTSTSSLHSTGACVAEVSTVQVALEAYNAATGHYPTAAADDTAAATETALNDSFGPGSSNEFLPTDLTDSSPSIAAGYRYTTTGSYSGGTCL